MLSQMLTDYAEANEAGKQDMFEEAAERMITAEKAVINVSEKLVRLQTIEADVQRLVDELRERSELNRPLDPGYSTAQYDCALRLSLILNRKP